MIDWPSPAWLAGRRVEEKGCPIEQIILEQPPSCGGGNRIQIHILSPAKQIVIAVEGEINVDRAIVWVPCRHDKDSYTIEGIIGPSHHPRRISGILSICPAHPDSPAAQGALDVGWFEKVLVDQVLGGKHTTPDKATGNNYGVGWTGSSGPDWVDEEVDLSPYAGSEIMLRFEYVTDQSYNGQGFAFKDFRILQAGIDEPGADDRAWTAAGWLRVDAPIPERWNLRLVRWTRAGVTVDPLPVDPDGTASTTLDDKASRSTLVIAPTAPRTIVPVNYSVTMTPPDATGG